MNLTPSFVYEVNLNGDMNKGLLILLEGKVAACFAKSYTSDNILL
jgi:hypothetical protein